MPDALLGRVRGEAFSAEVRAQARGAGASVAGAIVAAVVLADLLQAHAGAVDGRLRGKHLE